MTTPAPDPAHDGAADAGRDPNATTSDPRQELARPRGGAIAWLALGVAIVMLVWPMIRSRIPMPPPSDLPAAQVAQGYPEWSGRVSGAMDLRGRPGPEVVVDEWLNGVPPLDDRVIVIDFWATWCGPCIQAIPHMNELAAAFADDVTVIGVSNEAGPQFMAGIERIRRPISAFDYSLALDPQGRMQRAVQIRGIPHCVVMSRDGIVRWQGHPGRLSSDVLGRIVAADKGMSAG